MLLSLFKPESVGIRCCYLLLITQLELHTPFQKNRLASLMYSLSSVSIQKNKFSSVIYFSLSVINRNSV